MDSTAVLIIVLAGLFGGIAAGIPLAIVLGSAASLGLYLTGGTPLLLSNLNSLPYFMTAQYAFAVLPLFIWMGLLTSASGVIEDLFTVLVKLGSRIRGQLLYSTIAGGAIFGAACGSTLTSAVLFTKVALPEMLNRGYDKRLAAGSIASAGTLATIIPPSMSMVIYGMITQTSIGSLLIAGIVPGIIISIFYIATTYIVIRLRPGSVPTRTDFSRIEYGDLKKGLPGALGIAFLFLIVMGGIYAGYFTPTAAGAVGCFGAFLLVIFRKRFSWARNRETLLDSGVTTSRIFIVIVGGMLFARYLSFSGMTGDLMNAIGGLPVPSFVIMIVIILIYLLLGMFIDPTSMMVITCPMLQPLAVELGYSPIWFGILVTVLVEVAVLTPPVGFNVFGVVSSSEGSVSANEVFAGVLPYLIAMAGVIALMLAAPGIITWLPSLMR